MFKRSWLWSVTLIASLVAGSTTSLVAAENARIPNFASAEFGWLLQGGIGYRPVPGRSGRFRPTRPIRHRRAISAA